MAGERWATFDCYGTLIDWMSGIQYYLRKPLHIIRGHLTFIDAPWALTALTQGQFWAGRRFTRDYREGLELEDDDREALGESLPSWPPFPEVPVSLTELRARGWKLGILSNTDPAYLEASLELIGVPTDERVTASEIGSYKPAPGHWTTFFERTGADRGRHVHVAASLFHDIAPANELGLRAVWINRLHEASDLPRAAELSDLTRLPDTLEGLVAA